MNSYVEYWISSYDSNVRNCDTSLLKEKSVEQKDGHKNRKCTEQMFYRITKVSEPMKRSWLCFSPKTGRLYCFFCKVLDFSLDSPFALNGFFDWKHATNRLISDETSHTNLKAVGCFNNLFVN